MGDDVKTGRYITLYSVADDDTISRPTLYGTLAVEN